MRCTGGCDPDTLNNGFCPRCKTNRLVVCVACREVMEAYSYTRIGEKSHISSDRHKSNAEQKVNKTYAMWCNPKSFSNVDKLDSWAIRNKWACPPLFGMLQGKQETRAVRDVGLLMSTADWNAWPGEFSNYDSQLDILQNFSKSFKAMKGYFPSPPLYRGVLFYNKAHDYLGSSEAKEGEVERA